MRSLPFLLVTLCLWAAALPAAGGAPLDLPKLLKAVGERADRLEALQQRSSYLERSRIEVLDGDGKAESTSEVSTRVTWKDGTPRRELLRFVEDGEDVTEKKRGEKAKKRRDPMASPLTTREQPRYRFSIAGKGPDSAGRIRIRFEPSGEREGTSVGEVLVDPATALVSRMSLSPAELPTLADSVEITVELGTETPEGLLPSASEVRAKGGLPLFKKRYVFRTRFSEYSFSE